MSDNKNSSVPAVNQKDRNLTLYQKGGKLAKIGGPAPTEYSGRISLRIPKSLHKKLAEEAKSEGVSLNQYALYKLST